MDEHVGALDGIRVVDFGQYLAGPMVAMFLADNGADVVRIDPPGGPRWRHSANAALQRGKRSIELDLKRPDDLEVARRLVATADVVIENFRPGVMDRLGLHAQAACEANPGLIWCSMPGFAGDDPRAGLPAWEGIVMSAAGLYPPTTFTASGGPYFSALPFASNFGAFVAAHRIAASLLSRQRDGRGGHIEVALFDACFQAIGLNAEVPLSKRPHGANPVAAEMHKIVLGYHRGRDGRWLQNGGPLRGLQAMLDHFRPGTDVLAANTEAAEAIREDLERIWPRLPAAEWERLGQEEFKATVSVVQSAEEWLQDEHARSSECVVAVDDPELGATVQPGYPVRFSLTRSAVRGPRSVPGSDRDAVLGELAEREQTRVRPAAAVPADPRLPLDGVKVFDASILLAGPTTTRVLAQYGAEVIKIEKAGVATGDIDPLTDDSSCLLGHRTVNAGKRMMFLDLKHAAGRQVAQRIIQSCDVVHHNFPPETAQRLGLGLDQVRAARPDAIYSRVSLHSEGGYRSGYRGHDPLGQDVAGITHRVGGDGPPRKAALLINDHATGHLAAFGIMLALFHRNRTGTGQTINSALSRTSTMFQVPFLVGYQGRVWDEPAGLDAVGWGPFDRLYRASDRWFYLACPGPDARSRLAKIAELTGVIDIADDELDSWLAARFETGPAASWVAALSRVGVAAHEYVHIAELLDDETAHSRRLLAIVDHPGLGTALGIAHPELGGSGPAELLPARRPGMDTLALLAEYGFADETPELLRAGVVAVGENPPVEVSGRAGYWARAADVPSLAPEAEHAAAVRRVRAALGERAASGAVG